MGDIISCIIDGVRVEISEELIARYDRPLPRYTSYPPANAWGEFSAEEYARALSAIRNPQSAITLYIHIPFCPSKCSFCGCSSIATTNRAVMERYVRACCEEIRHVSNAIGHRGHRCHAEPFAFTQGKLREASHGDHGILRGVYPEPFDSLTLAQDKLRRRAQNDVQVMQIHLGGGTPASIGMDGLGRLIAAIKKNFEIADGAELAIELDPRAMSAAEIRALASIGFNRMSFGVQDFDEKVGAAAGRSADRDHVAALVDEARHAKVSGVNFDLIYGLPAQGIEGWKKTIGLVAKLKPDRIAVFNFAHLPRLLHHQRRIDAGLLPPPAEKLALFAAAIEGFESAGYAFIGLDHFAREGDELARAQREGRLARNFQGYTACTGLPIVGIGATAISELGAVYAQNEKRLIDYLRRIESGSLATCRGYRLSREDEMRRRIIRSLMCSQRIDRARVEKEWGAAFEKLFPEIGKRLRPLIDDGIVVEAGDAIIVTPLGRLFARAAAAAFDATLGESERRYSRSV